jgi:ribonuclease HI
MGARATMHIDGGSRGNPGPAAYAVVLAPEGGPVLEEAQTLGTATNNVAEYTGLIRGLKLAAERGIRNLAVFSDSELLVKQMNGEYRVRNPELQDLYRDASELRRRFDSVTLAHVRREQNKRADLLCNEAMDGRPRRAGEVVPEAPTAKAQPKKPKEIVTDERVRADAIECLRAAAGSWARSGVGNPPPEMVWDQLWSILVEAGVLKKR